MPRPEAKDGLEVTLDDPEVMTQEEKANFFREHLDSLRMRHEESLHVINRLLAATSQKVVVDLERAPGQQYKEKARKLMTEASILNMSNLDCPPDTRRAVAWKTFQDEQTSSYGRFQAFCQFLVQSSAFEYSMALVIMLNSVLVGIDLNMTLNNETDWLPPWVEASFVMIYVVEAFIRMTAMGLCSYFTDPWCLLDIFLTVSGFISSILMPLLGLAFGSGLSMTQLRTFLVMRSLRILRLMRALRALTYFRTVWRMVHGLLTSGKTMMSTLFLIAFVLYVSSCLGLEVITKDAQLVSHEETNSIISTYFSSLGVTFLTLSRFVSLDSAAQIYTPLILGKPVLALYFGAIVLFVSIALMNLVTATLVEGALANAQSDRDLDQMEKRDRLRKALPKLLQLFKELDTDESGTITIEEMQALPPSLMPPEIFEHAPVTSMEELFLALDVSGDGEVNQREFLQGLLTIFTAGVPLQTVQTMKLLFKNEHQLHELREDMQRVVAHLNLQQ